MFSILAFEPDMSQLIEDLEVVNKEKESLLKEKVAAETKCREYNDLVERQSRVTRCSIRSQPTL